MRNTINPKKATGGKGIMTWITRNETGKIGENIQDRNARFQITVLERQREIVIITNVYAPAEGQRANNEFFMPSPNSTLTLTICLLLSQFSIH